MKPIDDTKIVQDRKPAAHDQSAEHDRVAAAYLSRIYKVGSAADRSALQQWARATVHTPQTGGYGDGLFHEWLTNQLEALGKIEAAAEVAKDAKKAGKKLAQQRNAAEADIESLEKSITELQSSLEARQYELAGVEAEQKRINDAQALVAQTEDSAERGGVTALAWTFARDGKHPFE